MINPYEPPQAIDRPPPMAEPAPVKWPSVAETPQLPRAAANCAWAGQMLLLATLTAVLFLLSQAFENLFAGLFSAEFAKNLSLLAGLSTVLLFVGGSCKNLMGFGLFVQHVQDPATAAVYRMLFLLGLLKGALFAALVWVVAAPSNSSFLKITLLIALAFLLFHSVLMQAQTLRRWQALLARPYARGMLEAYKYLSLAAFGLYGIQVWYAFQEHREPWPSVIIGALLLLAGSMAVYAKLYRQLESALKGAGR